MAKFLNPTFFIIFLFLFSTLPPAEPSLSRHNPQTMDFIQSSCRDTRYPNLCIRCLGKFRNSSIQSPEQLSHIALSVSLSRATDTRKFLLKVADEFKAIKNGWEYQAVQDCFTQIDDSVDQLSQAIKELRRMSWRVRNINDDFLWHISNVETWVSTALTDASTCVDSLPGNRMSKMKATIKVKALNVAQVTSNALALFHRYAEKYRAEVEARKNKP